MLKGTFTAQDSRTSRRLYTCLLAVIATLGLAGCSQLSSFASPSMESSTSALALSPKVQTVNAGGTIQFKAAGGMAPYIYSVSNGAGYMTSTGAFIAPTSVAGAPQAVTVQVQDAAGTIDTAVVTVLPNGNAMSATYSPNPATPGATITIAVSGGTAPYTYLLLSGGGTLSGNTYVAPSSAETASIQVTDAQGQTTSFALTVGGAGTPLTSLTVSANNAHIVGGGGCASGSTQVGMIADAGGSDPTYGNNLYGDQVFCSASSSSTQYITNISITAGGAHVPGGMGCPTGYTAIGSFTDCTGGSCSGDQLVCVTYGSTSTGAVTDFYVTPSNSHVVGGPACNTGYVQVGRAADCGYGNCYGDQNFCVKH